MTVTLRIVADQVVHPTNSDLALASSELVRSLVETAPRGCDVTAIVPSGEQHLESVYPGLREVQPLPLARRELAASWQLGIAGTVGGGLIHSPTMLAPLVRHDRANRGDQTVVTLWDAFAWEQGGFLSRKTALWVRAMIKRAAKYADAVIVPTFALAERLADRGNFGERIRVIAGAAPESCSLPSDAAARSRDLNLPASFVVVPITSSRAEDVRDALSGAAGAITESRDVVIIGAQEGAEPKLAELAESVGIPQRHVHVRGELDAADRATVLSGGDAVVLASDAAAWPWRAMEAMRFGTPLVATDSAVHREIIGEGGLLVAAAELREAVAQAVTDDAERLRVLASDRNRSYSWQGAAEQVWQLHAEL